MTKDKKWSDDIKKDSVEKASEILPKIDLPQPGEAPIVVSVIEEPYTVMDKEDREMFVGEVRQLIPNKINGTLVYPKSLRFNIAKAITRAGKDFAKTGLTGLSFKIWSIEDNGQKFYQADMWDPAKEPA